MTTTATKQKVRVIADSNSESPREWSNLGTIVYNHPRYNLGDEKINDPIEWLEDMLGITNQHVYNNQRLEQLETRFFKEYIALPLYLYDHGGITMKTTPFGCRWDSGKVGYIYVSKEDVCKEYGWKNVNQKRREQVLLYLKGEIETFDQYLRGDIYGFIIEDEDGEHIDSCWGFYGDDFETNGMKDYVSEDLWEQLENVEVEYSY